VMLACAAPPTEPHAFPDVLDCPHRTQPACGAQCALEHAPLAEAYAVRSGAKSAEENG
jgi:hypothetical protein